MTPPSMVQRRTLHLEQKTRTKTSIQVEKEILIAIKVQGLNIHDITNIALEALLQRRNVTIPSTMDLSQAVKV